ncbi:Protein transport protein Sec61 subunit beta [Zostera marina]|uniref:Protein transport protein Sec61 subunit beta n=1 Tax=Zostera marina TaxID=29655 RepID=A0A0K9PCX6_ZOSMR|nr:Protein transport protein Sec61 subunit beta [Zostera marina]
MAKGASQSQSSSTASRTSGDAPRGSAAASAGMRRRRGGGGSAGLGGGKGGGGVGGGGGSSNMLRFYTDDAPGLKMTPTVVLVMSLLFIGFVTTLHVFGKVYRYKSAANGEA